MDTKHDRNADMFEAVVRGSTYSAAAQAGGITAVRARQVVNKMARMMMSPRRLGSDAAPAGDYWDVSHLREHPAFWLSQLEKWRTEHADVTVSR